MKRVHDIDYLTCVELVNTQIIK